MGKRRGAASTNRATRAAGTAAVAAPARDDVGKSPSRSFPIVGVGASAGGLEACTALLHALPADTRMAFVLVPHLDPTHISRLTEILARATSIPITEVTDDLPVEPDHVYVIPPGKNMVISKGILQLLPREPHGLQRPVDVFLRALAEDQTYLAIGVILSGMATDGTLGLRAIKAEGGITFAQDQTAQHKGMPHSAISAGCVDFVLPPEGIARELARIRWHPFVDVAAVAPVPPLAGETDLDLILTTLCNATGVDFTDYKGTTLNRRIGRRMVLHKLDTLPEYAQLLQSDPGEIESLFQDILISVTSFFRNPDAFEYLRTEVFPRLAKGRSRFQPVRMWVVGCSTGEEAYSLAIEWWEFAEAQGIHVPIQIYATDLNGLGVDKARIGFYPGAIVQEVSPARLRRHFVEVEGGYRIHKPIRDMCVFARHNVLIDPPFSRMDLVSCRNLLIYLEADLQRRVMPILHYALRPSGFLFLGGSETVGLHRDLFEVEEAKHKIFVKKPGASGADLVLASARPGAMPEVGARAEGWRLGRDSAAETIREADRTVLARYAPAGVLVNADLDILQFRGDTSPYLAPGPGRPSLNVIKMAREGLLLTLRSALHRARKEDVAVREEGVHVGSGSTSRTVSLEVVPIRSGTGKDRTFLVLFEEAPGTAARADDAVPSAGPSPAVPEEQERQLTRLTQELAATREYLQSVIEQQEAANEELQSANEEIQSINEELQSANEELETSKEEIESSNEELTTVNEELHQRNAELLRVNDDLNNLLASVQTAIVIVGQDLRIRRFTPAAEKLLNLIATDVGRPISDIKPNVSLPDLEPLLIEVIDAIAARELEVQDRQGGWYSLRARPYRTLDGKIEGAVLMLVDIDSLKRGQETLRRQAELLEQVQEPMLTWTLAREITYWNREAENIYGYGREQAIGRDQHELLGTTVDPRTFLDELARQGRWSGELTRVRGDGKPVVVESRMVLVQEEGGRALVVETNHPITERKRLEEVLRHRAAELAEADRRKNEFLAMLAHELRNPLASIANAGEVLRAAGRDAATAAAAMELMERQVRTMRRMIDDLIDVGRVAQGRIPLTLEPVDLVSIVTRAVSLCGHQFAARGQKFSITLPKDAVHVLADAIRLEQVVVNLLDNAAKYTPNGGNVWVSVSPETQAREAGRLREAAVVRVRDDGEGIATDMLGRVFELFSQADQSLARVHGGLGIGLTLVRRLVEMHGGIVEAESPGLGHGSTFTVRLPIERVPAGGSGRERREAESSPSGPSRPSRILVVDDFADAAESLAMLLRSSDHEVSVAHQGSSALEAVGSFLPEVVLLDIGMPGMDGYEIARQLRGLPGGQEILLLALTGYGQEGDRRRSKEAGFDGHLTKPVSLAALNEILAKRWPA